MQNTNTIPRFIFVIRITVFLLLSIPCRNVASAEPPSPIPLSYHALIIGISEYPNANGNGWTELKNATRDAQAVKDLLENAYNFEVTLLTDEQATQRNILQSIASFQSLTNHDALLIFYAGHGTYDSERGEGYWIPYDARLTIDGNPAVSEWILNTRIKSDIEDLNAQHILIISDACFSGSLLRGQPDPAPPKGDLTEDWKNQHLLHALSLPSRWVIASTSHDQQAMDSGPGNSPFTRQLLDFLKSSPQSIITVQDVAYHLRRRVGELTGQQVTSGFMNVSSHAGGEFVFLRKGATLPKSLIQYRSAQPSPVASSLAPTLVNPQTRPPPPAAPFLPLTLLLTLPWLVAPLTRWTVQRNSNTASLFMLGGVGCCQTTLLFWQRALTPFSMTLFFISILGCLLYSYLITEFLAAKFSN